ncbi:MAG: signal peptidase II [Candidatus Marinimicrobia bacterium]|nr:signal peptidase II [Candidatus Neomarinimicrobiota bacterium]
MNKTQKIILLIVCAFLFVGLLGLDIWSKNWIRVNLPIEDYYSWQDIKVAGNWLSFTHAENTGVAFSIPIPWLKYISIFALLFILYFFYRILKENPNCKINYIAFTIIFTGAIGNFIDRFLRGEVTDFIKVDFGFWPFNPFAIFNVADSCITVGVTLYLIFTLIEEVKHKKNPLSEETEDKK